MSRRIVTLLALAAFMTVVFSGTAIAGKPDKGAPDVSTESWFKKPKRD